MAIISLSSRVFISLPESNDFSTHLFFCSDDLSFIRNPGSSLDVFILLFWQLVSRKDCQQSSIILDTTRTFEML